MLDRSFKKILPSPAIKALKSIYNFTSLFRACMHDIARYFKYSSTTGTNSQIKLISRIIMQYHVVEKGLTMPQRRLGFGRDNMLNLCKNTLKYAELYGIIDDQIKHAIGVIKEYAKLHEENGFQLDLHLQSLIEVVQQKSPENYSASQINTSKDEYFRYTNSSFYLFSNSRKSIRNYNDEDVPVKNINMALELARNTPSVCNRQGWRTYVFTNKEKIAEIMKIQGGNRGFGHITNKLIIVTEELGIFSKMHERYQPFIDGGIYTMNLLYSLHFYKIATCVLNCSHTVYKDKELRRICAIKDSEVFIAMISCGNPPSEFMIASSMRNNLSYSNTVI